jgi:3,4-dihydroxy-2-butanone 4-phosphate synthase
MVPLRYTEGGVLARRGHTEAATGKPRTTLHPISLSRFPGTVYRISYRPPNSLLVDLCKLTNLPAAGLLCEIVKPDDPLGSMARRDDCKAFAQQWGFKMISIDQLQVHMEKQKKEGRV